MQENVDSLLKMQQISFNMTRPRFESFNPSIVAAKKQLTSKITVDTKIHTLRLDRSLHYLDTQSANDIKVRNIHDLTRSSPTKKHAKNLCSKRSH